MTHKHLILSVILSLAAGMLMAQNRLDIGFVGGASYYNGEFNENMPLYKPSPLVGAILRYNFNDYYSFRTSLNIGNVKGEFSGTPLLPEAPRGNFKKSLLSAEVMIEFNFLPIQPVNQRNVLHFAPYINAGGGIAFVNGTFTPTVPFGAGLKLSPGHRHTFAVEWMFHKTFTDLIDDYEATRHSPHAVLHNNDWFSYIGLVYTYRLPVGGRSTCPVYK